jgi:outer membrane lipoprotein LolB
LQAFERACSATMADIRVPALLAAALMVSACATMPESVDLPELGDWEQRNAVLGEVRDWAFRGRIAVKAGDDGFNGKFDWQQDGEAFDASVSGPLGMGTVRIEGNGRRIVLIDKDGVATELQDAETELRWRYGWTIPVTSLRFWALGIPDPGFAAATEIDAEGRLARLEQSNWTVEISRYAEGGGQPMPRILTATNPDSRVRMVIDRWFFFDN